MVRSLSLILPSLLLAVAGCINARNETALVSSNMIGSSAASGPSTRTSIQPATTESAARVDLLGRRILAANPQIGMKPQFLVIGTSEAEIFHKKTGELFITEGLVKQCQTEGQLAALLSRELGKMVSEREALAGPQARTPPRQPPPEMRVGNDNPGSAIPVDQVRLAELAAYERERKREAASPLPPDPDVLARIYLKKAGFADIDLQAAAPLLQSADRNMTLEKQILGPRTGAWGN